MDDNDAFIGEIRIFAGTYAPAGWKFCDGSVLKVQEYQALFAVIGKQYGGDGRTTFALPNLKGRAPMHWGQGAGLTERKLGEAGGKGKVTLSPDQMPSHTHVPQGTRANPVTPRPEGGLWAGGATGANLYSAATAPDYAPLSESALQSIGGGQPHNNMQSYLAINFIIALEGTFPVRG